MRTIVGCLGLCLAMFLSTVPVARALDLEGVALLGTGVDTGNAENNPYAFQLGGSLDLKIGSFVVGARATRSYGTSGCKGCLDVSDLRTIGGDFGLDWELSILHISPRVGIGHIQELGGGFSAAYFEPGGVAEAEFGILVAGIDIRYRFVTNNRDADGLLAYVRAGLRF